MSNKVRQRLVAQGDAGQDDFDAIDPQRNQQALAEYEAFKRMLDRVIGVDEDRQDKQDKQPRRKREDSEKKPGQHKGGELVQLDDDTQPLSPSVLPDAGVRDTAEEDADYAYDEDQFEDVDEGVSSYDEEIYQDDYQDLLEEVLKEQAEQDCDREDDPAFDDTETAWNTN